MIDTTVPWDDSFWNVLFARIGETGRAAFGRSWRPARVSVAPGRLELLGNHLDYNGGPVLAAAIDRVVAIAFDLGGKVGELHALAADVSTDIRSISLLAAQGWESSGGEPDPSAYILGVLAALHNHEHAIRDQLRITIAGNVPLGFGISSSAALCVALVNALAMRTLPASEVVLIAQEAEHRAGTPCGTMDQTASVAGNVIRYDGADDSWEPVITDLGNHTFAVADSGVSRSLGTSSYSTRVEEALESLSILRERVDPDLSALAQLSGAQWTEIQRHGEAWLPAPLFARVSHIVSERERVRKGITAVERRDWRTFGKLMTASGRSSATDYEISHPRVEELAAKIRAIDGVHGARMMGGGEGGPALILLRKDALPRIERILRDGYYRHYEMADQYNLIQPCQFGAGAKVINFPM